MSSEAAVDQQQHHSVYRPDDPEFYLENESPQNPAAELVGILGGIAFSVVRLVAMKSFWAPVNRVFLLQCTEGSLVRNKRLPHGGFGGILGCVHYILKKEGAVGFFRGGLTDMALSTLAYTAQVAVVVSTVRLQQRLASVSWTAAVFLGIAAPALRAFLSAPFVGTKNTVMCNYVADIVAPSSGNTVETVYVDKEGVEEEEAYLYCSAPEAAAAVRSRWGWKGLFFRGLDVDIAAIYTQSLVLQMIGRFVTPSLQQLIGGETKRPGRQAAAMITAAMGVRFFCSFLFQPFQVIRSRITLLSTSEETEQKQKRWFWEYAMDIMRQDGITAFWAGLRMRLLLDASNVLLGAITVQ